MRSRPPSIVILTAVVVLGSAAIALAQTSKPKRRFTAEEDRLNVGVFRAALKKRGLDEILEQHLADFPPKNEVDRLLLSREVKLAEFADTSRTKKHRQAAIADANAILRQLIATHGDDRNKPGQRLADWQFALVRSILYQEAEPLITSILYNGSAESERAALRPLTAQAVATTTALLDHLQAEFERIDAMSVQTFERLEKTGYIERLDQLEPQVRYVRLWAWFYDALGYDENDSHQAERLTQVVNNLAKMRSLLSTPHEQTGVQVQAYALLGMTYRRLNQHPKAREALRRAVRIGDRIADAEERERVAWAVRLARIETIRNERGAGRFAAAADAAERFTRSLPTGEGSFGLRLVGAMETRALQRAWSRSMKKRGQSREAASHRKASWQTLQELVTAFPQRRTDVYGSVYDRLKPTAPGASLDPFERCAVLNGLLTEAASATDQSQRPLENALKRGETYLALTKRESPELATELQFQLAVGAYRLGRTRQAAQRFLSVATARTDSDTVHRASKLAVELAAKTRNAKATNADTDLDALYLAALSNLENRYPTSEAAQYWRFFYAQQLDHLGRFDEAAAQYARVAETHEHYVEGLFLRLRAMTLALTASTQAGAIDAVAAHRRMDDVFEAHRAFLAIASRMMHAARDKQQRRDWQHLLARSRVLTAEAQLLPLIERYDAAVETVAGFEASFPEEHDLAARVWRVRLTTYQRLGQLQKAAEAIPAYLAAEPTNAGPTLQALFKTVTAEFRNGSFEPTTDALQQKAALALMLAQHIHTWSEGECPGMTPDMKRAINVQLAEANLWAGHYENAQAQFAALGDQAEDTLDQRIMLGRAEALYRLGQFDNALPMFNRLASALPPTDPIRWRAMLRDLQCRTTMGEDPVGIIQVIEQQSFLFPDLGGNELASQFQKLLRDNQRRRDTP